VLGVLQFITKVYCPLLGRNKASKFQIRVSLFSPTKNAQRSSQRNDNLCEILQDKNRMGTDWLRGEENNAWSRAMNEEGNRQKEGELVPISRSWSR
jgi:hypothetical protein